VIRAKRKASRAFTLIELLVVIAIIAILAAVASAGVGQGQIQGEADPVH